MSDLNGPLLAATALALRADAGVAAAFGAAPMAIYDMAPPNAAPPYLVVGPGVVAPIQAEGFDLSTMDYPVHVWSRPDPPAMDEAYALANAVRQAMLGVSISTGARVYAALPVRTTPLIDPSDERTVHVVVMTRFTTAPA